MKQPNRYHLWAALECHAFSKAEAVLRFSAEEDGMWIQWQDYARLKAEVERLTKVAQVNKAAAEAVRFSYEQAKTEVNRTTAWGRGLESDLSHARVEISFLKAEVERLKIDAYKKLSMRIEIDKLKARIEYLTNAGDVMADAINGDYNHELPCVKAWNAAKEGKPSV